MKGVGEIKAGPGIGMAPGRFISFNRSQNLVKQIKGLRILAITRAKQLLSLATELQGSFPEFCHEETQRMPWRQSGSSRSPSQIASTP